MARDAVKELRDKHATHGPPAAGVRRDTLPTDDRPSGSGADFGVVTKIVVDAEDPSKSHLLFRRVRAKDNPPQEGRWEMFGDELKGYPSPGARLDSYQPWLVGARHEFEFDFFPCLVVTFAGHNILVWIDKPEATPLDPSKPDSGCAGA